MNTPIQTMASLEGNRLYVKRDDLYPVYFGGNKARKAELFRDDLLEKKANYVVTYGSGSSNHCRAVAAMAAMHRLPCLIITPEETDALTSNKRLASFFGASYIYCPVCQVSETIRQTLEELEEKGFRPYFIPGGGHGNLGTQAYVNAYRELVDYEERNGLNFDYIFFASGTGTTHAGLVCGKHLYGNPNQKIIGISIARRNPRGRQVVLDSICEYFSQMPVSQEEVVFIDDYVGDGYGKFCDSQLQTMKNQLTVNNLPLDVTYTGKAFWGMEQYIKENKITDKNILFIHTGGTPLFFDDLERLI